jgi:hypothetical protein
MILERYRELARDLWPGSRNAADRELHLREAVDWIYRAQDATSDRGVSHSYRLGKGWARSYPETTGYIIPTLLNWAHLSGDDEPRRRALEMADWELTVQDPSGGVPSLADGSLVVFDTGQVLFGFLAAYRETGRDAYQQAARQAADWLLEDKDARGAWVENGRPRVYNARTAWALAEAAHQFGHSAYADRARAFFEWAKGEEVDAGWFRSNCLNDDERPLLHTIAYTAQGQLEAGLLLGNAPLVESARRTARSLAGHVEPSGRMPGRFDKTWKAGAGWACLTGMAQTVIVWRRLDSLSPQPEYAEVADHVIDFLLSTHDVLSRHPGIRGGIRGSFPVNGAYCPYLLPNWATKFFIDALFTERGALGYPG